MQRVAALALGALVACAPMQPLQHSGGTDANGCHTNSQTGVYHCHGGGGGGGGGSGETDAGVLAAVGILSLAVLIGVGVYFYVITSSPPETALAPPPPPPRLSPAATPTTTSPPAGERPSCWSRCPELDPSLKWTCRRRCEASEPAGYRWFCDKKCIGAKDCVTACLEGR